MPRFLAGQKFAPQNAPDQVREASGFRRITASQDKTVNVIVLHPWFEGRVRLSVATGRATDNLKLVRGH